MLPFRFHQQIVQEMRQHDDLVLTHKDHKEPIRFNVDAKH